MATGARGARPGYLAFATALPGDRVAAAIEGLGQRRPGSSSSSGMATSSRVLHHMATALPIRRTRYLRRLPGRARAARQLIERGRGAHPRAHVDSSAGRIAKLNSMSSHAVAASALAGDVSSERPRLFLVPASRAMDALKSIACCARTGCRDLGASRTTDMRPLP